MAQDPVLPVLDLPHDIEQRPEVTDRLFQALVGQDFLHGHRIVVLDGRVAGVRVADGDRGAIEAAAWALIRAGSVVTRDVPAGATAFGNPARVRR